MKIRVLFHTFQLNENFSDHSLYGRRRPTRLYLLPDWNDSIPIGTNYFLDKSAFLFMSYDDDDGIENSYLYLNLYLLRKELS